MKSTRNEIVALNNSLHAIKKIKGREVTYAISINKQRLDPIMKALQEQSNDNAKILDEYQKERTSIQEKYATVDGKVKKKSSTEYDIPQDKLEALEAELSGLQKKHKDSIEEHKKAVEDFKKFLEGEVDVDLYLIKKHDIPDDLDDVTVMDTLLKILKNPQE